MDVDSGWWSLRIAEQLESFLANIMIESLCIASRNVTWTLGGRRPKTGWRQGDFTDISIIIHLYLDPLLRADAVVRIGAVMAAAQCHSWSGDKIWGFVYETEWEAFDYCIQPAFFWWSFYSLQSQWFSIQAEEKLWW